MARLYGPGPDGPPALVSTSDLAGLSASDVDGRPVGELFGALSEVESGLIRYLDVSLTQAERHVLVPIGHARFDRQSVPPRVRLRAATREDLLSVPAFVENETSLDVDYQDELLAVHGRLFYGSHYYAHPAYDHTALHAGDSPIIGEESVPADLGLTPFSELEGFRLVRRAPTLLDWPMLDSAGERVGTITDLLVDAPARRARYVVVMLIEPRREAVVPVGYVQVDRDREEAFLPALTTEDVRLLPPYEPPLTREEENRINASIEGRLSGERYFQRADFRPAPDEPVVS